MDPASLYIELLKLSVSEALHPAQSALVVAPSERPIRGARVTSWLRYGAQRLLSLKGYELARRIDIPPSLVTDGIYKRGVPFSGETMIGLKRLDNVRHCVERVIDDHVPGDFIETGVWRGGCAIFMRGILAAYGVGDKQVWLADSFAGVPEPDTARYPLDGFSDLHNQVDLAVSREDVKANFRRYGLLDDQVRFLEGWFEETLPTLAGHTWAVIRLDGDLYQSTIEGLENLYPGLSLGGFCIVDDYGTYSACRQAVEDFRAKHKIDEPIVDIDGYGAFWRRTAEPAVGGDLASLHGAEEPRPEVAARVGKRLERAAPATPSGPRSSC
jgi:O-methyltransferase